MLGKMNNTSGKRSFTPVLAASSSAACIRRERNVSAKTPSAWAMGVPKRSVCTSMVTNCRMNSISRRSAMLCHAAHQQVERIRQGHADICLAASHQVRKNKVRKKKPRDGADQDRSYQVVGKESACHDSDHRQEKLHSGEYFHMLRLAKAGKCELVSEVLVKAGNESTKWLEEAGDLCGRSR